MLGTFGAADHAAWEAEYKANIQPTERTLSLTGGSPLDDDWFFKPGDAPPRYSNAAGLSDFIFTTVPSMKRLRADLALAKIANKDEAGRHADFHSLRVSLSTILAANRVNHGLPKRSCGTPTHA